MSFILVSIFVTAHFYREKGSIFIHSQNQRTIASFCVNSKVVSSDFSMMKNIVAPSFLSSLSMKLICCFKSGFFNSICLLKSIAINL